MITAPLPGDWHNVETEAFERAWFDSIAEMCGGTAAIGHPFRWRDDNLRARFQDAVRMAFNRGYEAALAAVHPNTVKEQ